MQRIDRTGETNSNNSGRVMTIITYRNANDMDIQFEDGIIIKHVRYLHFKKGNIRHPEEAKTRALNTYNKNQQKAFEKKYVGQKATMNCGEICEIIEYNSSKDITVQFQNTKTKVKTSLKHFKEHTIQDPNSTKTQLYNTVQKLLGTNGSSKYGTNGKITAIQSRKDITVTFEDGTILEHVTWQDFQKQNLITDTERQRLQHIGETKQTKNGMTMTITDYYSTKDITVIFEDGTKAEHKTYHDFNQNTIPHPLYPANNTSRYNKPTKIGHILRKQIAYKYELPNYYCTCETCLKSDIWNWKEIQTHNETHEKEG